MTSDSESHDDAIPCDSAPITKSTPMDQVRREARVSAELSLRECGCRFPPRRGLPLCAACGRKISMLNRLLLWLGL